ncbi:hypothetical protein AK812_SmicGene46727, partial [Symbiodinium microadriaticum]
MGRRRRPNPEKRKEHQKNRPGTVERSALLVSAAAAQEDAAARAQWDEAILRSRLEAQYKASVEQLQQQHQQQQQQQQQQQHQQQQQQLQYQQNLLQQQNLQQQQLLATLAEHGRSRRDAAAASTEGQVHDLVLQMNNLHDPELLQMVFVEKDFLRVLLNWLKRAGRIRFIAALEAMLEQETPEIKRLALGVLENWAPGVYPKEPGGLQEGGSSQQPAAAMVSKASSAASAAAKVSAKVSAKASTKVSAKASAKVSAKASAKVSAKASAKVSAKASAKVSSTASSRPLPWEILVINE